MPTLKPTNNPRCSLAITTYSGTSKSQTTEPVQKPKAGLSSSPLRELKFPQLHHNKNSNPSSPENPETLAIQAVTETAFLRASPSNHLDSPNLHPKINQKIRIHPSPPRSEIGQSTPLSTTRRLPPSPLFSVHSCPLPDPASRRAQVTFGATTGEHLKLNSACTQLRSQSPPIIEETTFISYLLVSKP